MNAAGRFDVTMSPQPADATAGGDTIGRLVLDKRYHGDLEATGRGQMLAVQTAVAESAGYVAMEVVEGVLHGKRGTFVLQHSGTMSRDDPPHLHLAVVPDSGTDELAGLTGRMTIQIVEGKHLYELDYALGSA